MPRNYNDPDAIIKKCSKCSVVQPIREFAKHKRTRDKLDSWCKLCKNIDRKKPHRIASANAARRKNFLNGKGRNKMLREKYGITLEDYNKMLTQQNNVCAICKKPETAIDSRYKTQKSLAVDHCHATGKIRGLLCDRCNTSIGKFNEDPHLLLSAADYLFHFGFRAVSA